MGKDTSSSAHVPRYREIANVLRKEIQQGKYPIGSLLPTEEVLDGRFKGSRQTIRAALQTLSNEGLIVRRTRVGSTVVATRPTSVLAQQVGSVEELLAYPPESYRKPVDSKYVKADPETAALLRCDTGTEWYQISMLRCLAESDNPICWTDIYVLPTYAGIVKHPQHLNIPVCVQIIEMYGESLERANVEIFAGRVPKHMAKRLKATAESPALYVVRRYRGSDGNAFEISVSVHPEKRFRVSYELQRELRVLKRVVA